MNTRRSRCANPAQSRVGEPPAISPASCGDTHSSASTKYTQSCRISGSRSAKSRCAENPSHGCSTTSAPIDFAAATVPSVEPESTTTTWSAQPTEARHRRMFGSSFSVSTITLIGTLPGGGSSPAWYGRRFSLVIGAVPIAS